MQNNTVTTTTTTHHVQQTQPDRPELVSSDISRAEKSAMKSLEKEAHRLDKTIEKDRKKLAKAEKKLVKDKDHHKTGKQIQKDEAMIREAERELNFDIAKHEQIDAKLRAVGVTDQYAAPVHTQPVESNTINHGPVTNNPVTKELKEKYNVGNSNAVEIPITQVHTRTGATTSSGAPGTTVVTKEEHVVHNTAPAVNNFGRPAGVVDTIETVTKEIREEHHDHHGTSSSGHHHGHHHHGSNNNAAPTEHVKSVTVTNPGDDRNYEDLKNQPGVVVKRIYEDGATPNDNTSAGVGDTINKAAVMAQPQANSSTAQHVVHHQTTQTSSTTQQPAQQGGLANPAGGVLRETVNTTTTTVHSEPAHAGVAGVQKGSGPSGFAQGPPLTQPQYVQGPN